jgi:hypothetical protein
MSHYKTPIRIQVNSTRKINDKIGKYRLPFRKDEPTDNRGVVVSRINNEDYVINTEVFKENEYQVSTVGPSGSENKEKREGERQLEN